MSRSKPTCVLVPGTWHPPNAYESFTAHLNKAGYPTFITNLPSLNAKEPLQCTCSLDAESIRQQLLPLIEKDGKEIVMLSHSYGGMPGGGAAYGLSKAFRTQQGDKGGLIGLVYMSSFIVPNGESLKSYLGGGNAPYIQENKVRTQSCGLIL